MGGGHGNEECGFRKFVAVVVAADASHGQVKSYVLKFWIGSKIAPPAPPAHPDPADVKDVQREPVFRERAL